MGGPPDNHAQSHRLRQVTIQALKKRDCVDQLEEKAIPAPRPRNHQRQWAQALLRDLTTIKINT
mgnify:CR=1 FL=1